ncbi:MAG: hypothetical protein KC776_43210 [Myxococcales bacterium]|nr:hypothetical protein [Myxococcales bacterium]MCB9582337.1 hypothetical protein [Polyangiaceae bacterium]
MPSSADTPRIADLTPGPVRVRGRAKSTGVAPLSAPRSGLACLCYSLADNAGGEHDAQDFWVEDDSGRVLVVMQDFTLDLGRSATAAAEVVDADIHAVQERLAKLAERARKKGNEMADALRSERKTLRKLYTLLCAIRAHRSGRCHVSKTLDGQQRYILEQSRYFMSTGAADGIATLKLVGAESLLLDGQEVQVEAEACLEQDPDARDGGYRVRPTRTVLRAPMDGRVVVRTETEPAPAKKSDKPRARARKGARTESWNSAWLVLLLVAAVFAVVVLAKACAGA